MVKKISVYFEWTILILDNFISMDNEFGYENIVYLLFAIF